MKRGPSRLILKETVSGSVYHDRSDEELVIVVIVSQSDRRGAGDPKHLCQTDATMGELALNHPPSGLDAVEVKAVIKITQHAVVRKTYLISSHNKSPNQAVGYGVSARFAASSSTSNF